MELCLFNTHRCFTLNKRPKLKEMTLISHVIGSGVCVQPLQGQERSWYHRALLTLWLYRYCYIQLVFKQEVGKEAWKTYLSN